MLAPGSKFGDYLIEEVIGAGTMGVVYRAVDTRLDRTVALKLIADKLAKTPGYKERLASEARAAAKIDSPYVVKVWEYSEINGRPYISLEYLPGNDLRSAFDADFPTRWELARQIALGLKAAHDQGLVHRDLKPENIKIAPDGVAKILDFGLAKSVYADSVDQFGNIEGTLYYLSPEQITGENVTCLSDIFSFGVVLYELLTGRRPFEGVYSAAIVYSILHEDPPPPTSIQKELPSWADGFLLKLLAKQSSARFAGIAEVAAQMETCLRTQGKPCPTDELKSRQTVTVIDLKNLSPDTSWEYFCVGFTEELINELSRRTNLVIAAEPSTSYSRDIREMFERFRTDFIIIGSLMKWQDKIKLHLKIYTRQNAALVSGENYESDAVSIFTVLSQAAHDTAEKLFELTGHQAVESEGHLRTDVAAFDFYLQGKNYYRMNKPEELVLAERMFKKALEIDPMLAHAHSGLSDIYAFQFMAYYERTEEKIAMAKSEALQAIQISPQLPEAHRSLGRYYMLTGNYIEGEKSLLRAVELNPKFAVGYRTLAWLKELAGDHEKSVYWANMALRYAPNDLETLLLLSIINMDLRRYTAAMATLQRAIELAPDYGRAYYGLGTVYMKLGVLDLALENFYLALKYKGDPNAYIDAGFVLIILKEYEEARIRLNESIRENYFSFIAYYYLGLLEKICGNQEEAQRNFQQSEKLAREAIANDLNNPHIQAYRALALASLGNFPEALNIIQNLEAIEELDGDVIYHQARVYALTGDQAKARTSLDRALKAHAGPSEKEAALDPHFSALFASSKIQAA
jgi:serine/threonine protein kinase/Flp pilus assembly protein TadD